MRGRTCGVIGIMVAFKVLSSQNIVLVTVFLRTQTEAQKSQCAALI